jgi:protein-L-isoaspartate(D-aspartate) O-methyltransferase
MLDWRVAQATAKLIGTDADRDYVGLRRAMVEEQLRRRGVKDERVLQAMANIPRHEFVPQSSQDLAYSDEPLGIGDGQTISQPYMVASMTGALGLSGSDRVLEIGTGSGYQAAVLSVLSKEVYSIESRTDLANSAAERLRRLGFHNVHQHVGDGTLGLKEYAPFDAILVGAAGPELPQSLLEQLGECGRMIMPVGPEERQQLVLVSRRGNEILTERREPCRFVPLVGQYGRNGWHLL